MERKTLSELLGRRRELVTRLGHLESMRRPYERELEEVEREVFGRLNALASVIEGPGSDSAPAAGQPVGGAGRLRPPTPAMHASWVTRMGLVGEQVTAPIRSQIEAPAPRLADYIIAILRETGKPMSRNEIYDALMEREVVIPGKNPKANLSAHLSYATDVTRDEDGLWTVRQQGIEEAARIRQEEEKEGPA